MQNLNITLVQSNQRWEDKEANMINYESLLANLGETDIILLPEMCMTGFSMNVQNLAENFSDSRTINWLKKIAKSKDTAVYTSIIIEENGTYRNRGTFVFPDGKVDTYDKRKSFGLAGEDSVYTSGNAEKIVVFRGWKIQLQICYDLRFPEIVRNRMEKGIPAYDLILYTANWPAKRSHHWKTLLAARAIENQCYVAAVNRTGEDGNGLIYTGDSAVIDPLGEGVTILNKEEVKSCVLSMHKLMTIREQLPFLKDR